MRIRETRDRIGIGPLGLRPYFLIRLDEGGDAASRIPEIIAWVNQINAPLDEVFVLSHGWHRNFYSAVSAYDRIMSRFVQLAFRQRLDPAPERRELYLTLHWHSDPGTNRFYDKSGRRSKDSFLENIQNVFVREANDMNFLNFFEDVFELFSRQATTENDNLAELDDDFKQKCQHILRGFNAHALKGENLYQRPAHKLVVAWDCYHRATVRAPVTDQTIPPHSYENLWEVVWNTLKFLVSVVGPAALLGALWKYVPAFDVKTALIGVGVLFLTGVLWLGVHTLFPAERKSKTASIDLVAAWVSFQAPLALAFLLLLLIACVFGRIIAYFTERILFSERSGERNQETGKIQSRGWSVAAAAFVRTPTRWLKAALKTPENVPPLVDTVDGTLAFWEMQIRGVDAGRKAALFLEKLLAADTGQRFAPTTRFHFVGHSFGGLVLLNAVRHIVHDAALKERFARMQINSLTLLQAAVASDWLRGETKIRERITGAIGCIFSRYDTANSFYYPLANGARMAAGYVGLTVDKKEAAAFRLPLEQAPEQEGLFAMLAHTPDLKKLLRQTHPFLVNLDASRMIFDGPVASGGGHSDIFKDDIIHLCWAVSQAGRQAGQETQPREEAKQSEDNLRLS